MRRAGTHLSDSGRAATDSRPSGPVSFTLLTLGTMRQTSTVVSVDGALVAGSISFMLGGSVNDADQTVLAQIAEVGRLLR